MAFGFKDGFTRVPNGLLLDSELKSTHIAVYLAIASFCYGNRRSWMPSYAQVARRAGCAKGTAIRAAKKLQERGWIIIRKVRGRNGSICEFELVESREAFLADRSRRDKTHAQKVERETQFQKLQIQKSFLGKDISAEEANRKIAALNRRTQARSPRVSVPLADFIDEAQAENNSDHASGQEVDH